MTSGKIASQAGHGYIDAFLDAQANRPDTIPLYKTGHGIKICLKAKSQHHLERAYNLAVEAEIPCALITDLGYTCFDGVPTVTALGLGPAKKSEIKHITKRFQLLE